MNYYIIAGQQVKVPTSYADLSFDDYTKIFDGRKKTKLEVISIMIGVDVDVLAKCKIGETWTQLLKDTSFIETELKPDYIPPQKVKLKDKIVDIPLDIGKETTAQYSDIRELLDKDTNENLLMVCAIYLQPLLDGVYNIEKAKELKKDIGKLPCDFVICMGSFFLLRALGLRNGFLRTFLKAGTLMRRFKRVMNGIRKSLGL